MVSESRKRRKKARRRMPPGQRLVLLLLLGCAACASVLWFAQHFNLAQPVKAQQSTALVGGQKPVSAVVVASPLPFKIAEELTDLKELVKKEADLPKLHAGLFVVEPDSGKFVDLDAHRAYSAASMIKLPVLVALGQALDAKRVSLTQDLVIRDDLIGGGSGWLQWRKPGSHISLKDTAELMMIISDNTATNMIIDALGGKDVVNSSIAQWGLTATHINNPLPDLTGTNTTSPYDLACLLGKIESGQLVSPESRAWMLDTLGRNKHRNLLPKGLPPGTKICDKTGDIASLVGDAGIVTCKSGQKYIAVVAVERPTNDRRANALIRKLSKEVYIGITGDADGVKNLDPDKAPKKQVRSKSTGRRRSRRHR